jgi:hypothetical protein
MGDLYVRWRAFADAAGHRRYLLAALVSAALAFADWLQWAVPPILSKTFGLALRPEAPGMIFGFPSWLLGITLGLGVIAWWLLEYAVSLKKQLTPSIELDFRPTDGGIVTTPVKVFNQNGQLVSRMKAIYIRGVAVGTSELQATDCIAYLTGVRKQDQATKKFLETNYLEDIRLHWAHIGYTEVRIPKNIKRHFDILYVDDKDNKLQIAGTYPLIMADMFDDHTKYQLDLAVVGSGITKNMTIEVAWNGEWDKITASRMTG